MLHKDKSKWHSPSETKRVISLIYTAQPEKYAESDSSIVIRRPLSKTDSRPPNAAATEKSCLAYEEAVNNLGEVFRLEPFRFLREKDFETYLFSRMRAAVDVNPNELHPVRTQWWSAWANLIGRRRRHDLVVLAPHGETLALEVELKTSHSDQHNWFRTRDLIKEFDAMHQLVAHKKLKSAIFLMFRFGPPKWQGDAKKVCDKYPNVTLDYRFSD